MRPKASAAMRKKSSGAMRGTVELVVPIIRNIVSVNSASGTDTIRSGCNRRVIVAVI